MRCISAELKIGHRKVSDFLVRLKGLEPPRRRHQILSLARLPIPPQPHNTLTL